MLTFKSKVLVFTDLHFGIHANNQSYLDICSNTIKWISDYSKTNGISEVLFMGDFFDSRSSLDVKTFNIATESLYNLVNSGINLTLILGNHDIYLRDSTSIHSLLAFAGHNGISVVDKPAFVDNGKCDVCLLPWMYGTKNVKIDKLSNNLKYVFCHHNFPETFFFGTSKKKTSDTFVSKRQYEDEYGIQQEIVDSIINNEGTIFSGHIHQNKEVPLKGGKSKIIIEGSPYETSWGFGKNKCGVYVVDFENDSIDFLDNPNNKVHVEIRTSEYSEKNIKNIDFNNSIVRLNVDTQESFDKISKIQAKIASFKPFLIENTKYEFTAAEFVGKRNEDENPLDSISHKVSSKLDYINKSIDAYDFSAFSLDVDGKTENIDKNVLKDIAKELFDNIAN